MRIYYFSASGNSLEVVNKLRQELEGAFQDVELINIAEVFHEHTAMKKESDGVIGFVFPVYALGMPRMVYSFIEKVKFFGNEYIFAVTTHGGAMGAALYQAGRLLERNGLGLSYAIGIRCPGNYLKGITSSPEKEVAIRNQMNEQVKLLAQKIRRRKVEYNKSIPGSAGLILGALNRGVLEKFKSKDARFYTNSRCNGCGICEKVCPRKNIVHHENKVLWKGNCEICLACKQWCPQNAIENDFIIFKRLRYQNPSVTLRQIMPNSKYINP